MPFFLYKTYTKLKMKSSSKDQVCYISHPSFPCRITKRFSAAAFSFASSASWYGRSNKKRITGEGNNRVRHPYSSPVTYLPTGRKGSGDTTIGPLPQYRYRTTKPTYVYNLSGPLNVDISSDIEVHWRRGDDPNS